MALDFLEAITGADRSWDRKLYFVHPGAPQSKARARIVRRKNGRGTYAFTPTRTKTAEAALADRFRSVMNGMPIERNVAIVAVFYRPNLQRIDADNLMKLVLDAGTRAKAWYDDCQVTLQASRIELDRENPRTLVALCEIESTLARTRYEHAECKRCRSSFRIDMMKTSRTRGNLPIYCSKDCARRRGRKPGSKNRPKIEEPAY